MSFDDHAEVAPPPGAKGAAGEKAQPPPSLSIFGARALKLLGNRISGVAPRIKTPFPALDKMFGGGLLPMLIVIVAGTGFGKSTLAMQLILSAIRQGVPSLYVGLELGYFDVYCRLWGLMSKSFSWSEFFNGAVESGNKNAADMNAEAAQFTAELGPLPMHINEAPPGEYTAREMVLDAKALREAYRNPSTGA